MSRTRFPFLVLVVCSLLIPAFPALAANSVKSLPPTYRHWIEAEVPYIVSRDERKQFLSLTTDEQRDSFIAAFWRVRNPDPGSDSNTYKEEHYRRLAYANEHFGNVKYEDGWRSEMGRIYIILGPPKQRAPYHEKPNLRDMEIWFYEADTPALPPYFYILFYKRSASENYRIYSPTLDGPVALVTTGESQNDNKMALRFIKGAAGNEVAKTTCTLLPTESCDLNNFSPSMDSDMMLATINDLPDNALVKQQREANGLREHVTSSILIGDQDMAINSAVFRDEEGRETLSYLLSSPLPDARLVGKHADGSLYYDLALRTSVLTADGKPVFDQEDLLTGKLTEAQAEVIRKKRFCAEARIPLAPGHYTLVATLTNEVNHIAARQHASINVPAVNPERTGISELLEYAAPSAVPDLANQLPFSLSKLRFTPRGVQSVYLRAGDKLRLVFQLWLDPRAGDAAAPEKVHLHYVFGAAIGAHDTTRDEDEDIDAGNRDAAGNLVSGHTLDTSSLPVGIYRVVVSATREGSKTPAYAAMTLHVVHAEDYAESWTAYGPVAPGGLALDDLKRGLAAEAQGQDDTAKGFYQRSIAEGAADPRPIEKLAALFERRGENDALAALSRQPMLAQTAVSPKSLIAIGQALNKTGNPKGVVRMLEAQIKLQPPSAELYRMLADACEATGDSGRARDLRSLAAGEKN